MNKLFEEQLRENAVVTEEILEKLKNKNHHNYTNGDPIKVGDQVLYAYRYTGEPYDDPEFPNGKLIPVEYIRLNKDQIDQYDFKKGTEHLQAPVVESKR